MSTRQRCTPRRRLPGAVPLAGTLRAVMRRCRRQGAAAIRGGVLITLFSGALSGLPATVAGTVPQHPAPASLTAVPVHASSPQRAPVPEQRQDTTTSGALPSSRRVITLAPHITELVFAAGAGGNVVATVNSSNYPPEVLALPRVGDGLSINAEQLLTLQPDLIVAWHSSPAIQKLTPVLNELAIAVMFSEPRQLDDIPAHIERLGHALGTSAQAEAKAHELREQLTTLRNTYAKRRPVSVFIEVGTHPLYTLGNDTLTNDALAACGGVNIFQDSPLVAPTVAVESVLARQPEVVLITSAAQERVDQRAAYWHGLQLGAARHHHVYGIDPDTLLRPGPRLLQATQELCQILERARDPAHAGL